MHLNKLQPKGREHCNTTNEELTTQKSRTLQKGNWRTFDPNAKDMVARPLNKYTPTVKELVTRHWKNSQSNGQWNCNKAIGELTN